MGKIHGFRSLRSALCLTLVAVATAVLPGTASSAATLPSGFQESIAFSGLTNPTVVRFARDGRVFVAEKRGVIKVFDSLADTTPDVFADLNVNVYNFWDRGLLGLARPQLPSGSVRVRALHLRPRAGLRRPRAPVGHVRCLRRSLSHSARSDRRRVRRERSAVPTAGER